MRATETEFMRLTLVIEKENYQEKRLFQRVILSIRRRKTEKRGERRKSWCGAWKVSYFILQNTRRDYTISYDASSKYPF